MNTQWQTSRILLGLLLAAVVITCLFSLFLPASASLLPPTASSTPTSTLTPTATPISTVTLSPLPAHLITPYVTEFTAYTVYFRRDLWENATGEATGHEDFEKDPFAYKELSLPYYTGNGFILTGTSAAQILIAPELLDSGNLIHFGDFEHGLSFTFPNNAAVSAFGFDYTSSEDWLLTVNQILTPLPIGRNRFLGVVLRRDLATQFTLSGPPNVQRGLSVDNIVYVTASLSSTPTSTPEPPSNTPTP